MRQRLEQKGKDGLAAGGETGLRQMEHSRTVVDTALS
jgi:hypothetical protein